MARRVAIYCPDRHLTYDGRTPDGRGVGGGVTARIRVASALARRGNEVTVICNCAAPVTHEGVRYAPLDTVDAIATDVLVLHTTGGELDLRPVLRLDVQARRSVVFVDGVDAPIGLDRVRMDRLIAPSNFIREVARDGWGVDRTRIFVSHHGVRREFFAPPAATRPARTLHRVAYATHPSKGYAAAVAVLRLLRGVDSRFELHVFGGHALWGQQGTIEREPGVVDHGLVGQRDLARGLMGCGFALYLQTRLEPFGIAITEALAAGCVTVASPVGAHPELIDHERSGFLVDGDPADATIRRRAADLVLAVAKGPERAASLRENAARTPLDWDVVARTWEQWWTWLDRPSGLASSAPACPECAGDRLLLADGYHCTVCGHYGRKA
jgi:glycosyltransferase involved in cell wall biosynthesis